MKKTAVEWLFKWMIENKDSIIEERLWFFEQAKAMEKAQIIDAFFEGKNDGILMERYSDYKHITPNEYYNETFRK